MDIQRNSTPIVRSWLVLPAFAVGGRDTQGSKTVGSQTLHSPKWAHKSKGTPIRFSSFAEEIRTMYPSP